MDIGVEWFAITARTSNVKYVYIAAKAASSHH